MKQESVGEQHRMLCNQEIHTGQKGFYGKKNELFFANKNSRKQGEKKN